MLPGVLLVLVMAQPNLAAGLMPFYRAGWGLDPLMITVVFAAYLFALVPTLLTIGRPPTRIGWWWRIGAGSACGVTADIVMAVSDSPWVACVARVAAGLSVGLVTGSLAGLILERIGERGRTGMATGTVLGSAIGVMAAAVFAQYLPAPAVTVYVVHALLLGACAVAVCTDRRGAGTPAPGRPAPAGLLGRAASRPVHEPPLVGYLSGCAAWISAGLVGALLPSYGAELLRTANLALLALPVTGYLLSAWAVQRLVARGALPAEPVTAQVLVIAGVVVMAVVPVVRQLEVLIAGGMLAGFGQGIAYRAGLHIVSAASEPGRHARVAARYAAVAYLCAAIATVGLGIVANATTMPMAVVVAALVLTFIATVSAIHRLRSARVSPTVRTTILATRF